MTPEQEALVRKAQDSLLGAEVLASQKLFDFAVSRAYYTMFYVAEAFLLEEGLTFSKHSGVIAAFGEHFVKTGRVPKEFHRYLIDGERKRVTGDYDIGPGCLTKKLWSRLIAHRSFWIWQKTFLVLCSSLSPKRRSHNRLAIYDCCIP